MNHLACSPQLLGHFHCTCFAVLFLYCSKFELKCVDFDCVPRVFTPIFVHQSKHGVPLHVQQVSCFEHSLDMAFTWNIRNLFMIIAESRFVIVCLLVRLHLSPSYPLFSLTPTLECMKNTVHCVKLW